MVELSGPPQLAGSVTEHLDLCDHLAAYSAEHPLLIYPGTFREPLFVASRIPRQSVEAFSLAIGVPLKAIDFLQTSFPDASLPNEANG
jgi:hypothetical protein